MSKNDFDRLVAEKITEATFAYDPDDFKNMSAQLASARKKKRALLFFYTLSGVAASLAVCILAVHFWSSKQEINTVANTKNTNTIKQIMPAPLNPSLPVTSSKLTTLSSATSIVPAQPRSRVLKPATSIVLNKDELITKQQTQQTVENNVSDSAKQTQSITDNQPREKYGYKVPEESAESEKVEHVHRTISIGVAGGVNYGTLNTGYALGATLARKISNKVGIELALGYINNNSNSANAASSANNNSPINNFKPKTTIIAPLPLNYLQCTPVADYSLSKKLTVAAGADIERLLQSENTPISYNDNTKIAPLYDLGALFKTDYAVTSRLKGGISYRIGANNLLSAGKNYIDRNYMQVQLKYRLR